LKLPARHLFIWGGLLGALVLLYVKTNPIVFAEHERFYRNLLSVQLLDMAVNQDVLKARFGLIDDYSGFTDRRNELKRTVADLEATPSFISETGNRAIKRKVAELSRLLAQKDALLERFKSENAVIINSLRDLPIVSSELFKQISLDEETRELEAPLNQLTRLVLFYSLHSNEDQASDIRRSLERITEWRSKHGHHPQADTLANLFVYVNSILIRNPKIEAITGQLMSVPTGLDAEKLVRFYQIQFSQALAAANSKRVALYGLCTLLVLGIGYTIYELNAANTHLERRVLERTDAFAHKNEEFQASTSALTSVHAELQASEQRFRMLSASAPIGIFETDTKGGTLYTNPYWQNLTGLSLSESLSAGWMQAVHPEDQVTVFADWNKAVTEGNEFDREFRFCRPNGEIRWVHARSAATRSKSGEIIALVGTTEDISRRKSQEKELNHMQRLLTSVIENLPITVFLKEATELRFVLWNKAGEKLLGYSNAELIGKNDYDFFPLEQADYFTLMDRETLARRELVEIGEETLQTRIHGPRVVHTRKIPILDSNGEATHLLGICEDITDRKRSERELEQMHKELLETSRQAGMAEVATGVLHNVGNVLNSVNVSSVCVAEGIKKSKLTNLFRLVALLRTQTDMAAFVTTDSKGKQLTPYLATLANHLASEQGEALKELAHLQKNIEHIKDIVTMQQSFAKVSGVTETLNVSELVEDALKMNASSLARHDIQIFKEFKDVPSVTVEKHKVLQILVNLIRNAKHACDDSGRTDKQLTLRVANGDGRVRIAVFDNGVGIPPENLARIFSHGFTTKKDGHGFGLHSGALAARELGGSLTVNSEGVGKGAAFTLELPLQPT
jgi:PAS domain S-box-containing protein